jgi:hypothetical protein
MSREIKTKIPRFNEYWKPKLEKAGLNKDQISIIVHNFDPLIEKNLLGPRTTEKFLNNLVNDSKWRMSFLKNPKGVIDEANPQPSP